MARLRFAETPAFLVKKVFDCDRQPGGSPRANGVMSGTDEHLSAVITARAQAIELMSEKFYSLCDVQAV